MRRAIAQDARSRLAVIRRLLDLVRNYRRLGHLMLAARQARSPIPRVPGSRLVRPHDLSLTDEPTSKP
jgi:hypothetical protein